MAEVSRRRRMTVEAEMQKQLVVKAGDEGLTAVEQFYALAS